MINLSTYKEKTGRKKLVKQSAKNARAAQIINWNDANTIGILFNASNTVYFEIIRNIVKTISKQKKDVSILGYVNSKKVIDHYLYRKGFEFFTQKELNWYMNPKSSTVNSFVSKPFDILLNLSLEDYLPIQFIVAGSKARFKVSKYFETSAYADLMINIEENRKVFQEVRKEVKAQKKVKKQTEAELQQQMEQKTENEIQLNFLIEQVMHYLKQVRTK